MLSVMWLRWLGAAGWAWLHVVARAQLAWAGLGTTTADRCHVFLFSFFLFFLFFHS
jgi:hypothetical protein